MATHMKRILTVVILIAMITAAAGCEAFMAPPRTVLQYEFMPASGQLHYPRRVIALYNMQRALDPDASLSERVASLHVVEHVGMEYPEVCDNLRMLANDPETPAKLGLEASRILWPVDQQEHQLAAMSYW